MHRVTQGRASDDHRLWLRFEDGLEGSVFLGNLLEVVRFDAWRDARRFCRAAVDPVMSTVVWEDGLVLDPDILYQDLLSSRPDPWDSTRGGIAAAIEWPASARTGSFGVVPIT